MKGSGVRVPASASAGLEDARPPWSGRPPLRLRNGGGSGGKPVPVVDRVPVLRHRLVMDWGRETVLRGGQSAAADAQGDVAVVAAARRGLEQHEGAGRTGTTAGTSVIEATPDVDRVTRCRVDLASIVQQGRDWFACRRRLSGSWRRERCVSMGSGAAFGQADAAGWASGGCRGVPAGAAGGVSWRAPGALGVW